MKNEYIHYTDVSRTILDTVKVGDLISVNDWKKPMRVKAVSENYFVMTQNFFGKTYYSVCSKLPWKGVKHNAMTGGMFHCGPDNYIFGSPLAEDEHFYRFEDEKMSMMYLQEFEDEKCAISERHGIPIYDLYVKSCRM